MGYRNTPGVTFTGGTPSQEANATAVLDEKTGRLSSITLDSGGIGYSTAPTVEVTGGGGKDGVVNIDIQSMAGNITSSGSGYLAGSYPNVQFTGGSPTTIATGTFVIPGLVELSQMVVLDILMVHTKQTLETYQLQLIQLLLSKEIN